MFDVKVIVDMRIERLGCSLTSVDKFPGFSKRCLYVYQIYVVPGHGGLKPEAHLKLLVIMFYQCVYNTKTIESVTLHALGYIMYTSRSLWRSIAQVHVLGYS